MKRPTNRSELAQYLKEHPHLVYRCPDVMTSKAPDTIEGRTFTRATTRKFYFRKPDGSETSISFKVNECRFHDDRIEVRFPASWEGLEHECIIYWYLQQGYEEKDRPTYEEKTKEVVTI